MERKQPIKGIKKKRLLKKNVDYLKSDSYMYASMSVNKQMSSSKGKFNLDIAVFFNTILHASLFTAILLCNCLICCIFYNSGSIRYVEKVTMEIPTRNVTMDKNELTVPPRNPVAEDQILERNLPEGRISASQT